MKESGFIDQNHRKWSDFHKMVDSRQKDPGRLSRLFIQITDDLSFARTFYPNRSIRSYLNALAEGVFIHIHRSKRSKVSDFVKFWKVTLPMMNYRARWDFLVSFVVFSVALIIGMVSSANDETFPAFIMGNGYVEMALKNIEKGDPMSVYKEFLPFNGFIQITLNNLLVSAYTFIGGVFSAIGTIFIMFYNGVMVGSFQQFYINHDLFRVSFLTIWQHGTLEISSIIIAGAAGLTMGRGLLFPGTYSRMQSFSMSARRGLKIFIGIIPTIILAGFIESFLTRFTEMPAFLRVLNIFVSLAIILAYYVWYPRKVARSKAGRQVASERIEVPDLQEIDYRKIYTGGQLFENTMIFFGRHFTRLFRFLALFAAIAAAVLGFAYKDDLLYLADAWFDPSHAGWFYFINFKEYTVMFPVMSVLFSAVVFLFILVFIKNVKTGNGLPAGKAITRAVVLSVFAGTVTNLLFFLNFWLAYIISVFLLPLLITIGVTVAFHNAGFFRSVVYGIRLFFYKYNLPFGLSVKFGILMIVMLLLMFTFVMMFPRLLFELFDINPARYEIILSLLDVFAVYLIVFSGIGMMVSAMGQMYFTVYEIITAENLLSRIEDFGRSKKILGYERE